MTNIIEVLQKKKKNYLLSILVYRLYEKIKKKIIFIVTCFNR